MLAFNFNFSNLEFIIADVQLLKAFLKNFIQKLWYKRLNNSTFTNYIVISGAAGQYQAIMREVELGVTPRPACQAALRGTNLGTKFNLHEGFLCAGGLKGLDTCIGDGGGPLVCPSLIDPWRYVLVGIVSWGVNCGTYGVPGVYIDVPKYRTWIDNTISLRYPFYNANRWTISGSAVKAAQPQQDG